MTSRVHNSSTGSNNGNGKSPRGARRLLFGGAASSNKLPLTVAEADLPMHEGNGATARRSRSSKGCSSTKKYNKRRRCRTRLMLAWQQQAVAVSLIVFGCVCGILAGWHWLWTASIQTDTSGSGTSSGESPLSSAGTDTYVQALAAEVWEDHSGPAAVTTFRQVAQRVGGSATDKTNMMAQLFAKQRLKYSESHLKALLDVWLEYANAQVSQNLHSGRQWIPSYLLPSLTTGEVETLTTANQASSLSEWEHYHVFRMNETDMMAWKTDWELIQSKDKQAGDKQAGQPLVDYTDPTKYQYPETLLGLPEAGTYPEFRPLQQILQDWPQETDVSDNRLITETLIHFNYSDPVELAAARRFRDAELPFKLTDVPEVTAATLQWTDEYLTKQFDESGHYLPGSVQEAKSNYNLFYTVWDMFTLGLPPVRYNDWNFHTWSQHARYADAAQLSADQPHFYFQAAHFLGSLYKGRTKWEFLARDLPSFSYAQPDVFKETFFVFHPDQQQGLQCRFGERGVLTASHYDGTRNFVAMVTGAKRYILAPPRECSKLGLVRTHTSPMYRHSLLNYDHFAYLDEPGMSEKESDWLKKAGPSQAVETVLKAGEVLYLPCYWFHYIVSLQKSAQCNVRSAADEIGNPEFGGHKEVLECKD